jgi:hypothetical protein
MSNELPIPLLGGGGSAVIVVGGLLVDAELTARLATAGEEELTNTFTRLKPQFSALLTHNQVAHLFSVLRIPDGLIRIGCLDFLPVLRIRDVYPGFEFCPSRIQIFSIPVLHQRI